MELVDYLPVMIQLLLAAVIAAAILIASHIFGQRARGNYASDSAYECGMLEESKPHPKFSVKFYVVAMLFILFDIEMVFMIPWVLIYRELLSVGILSVWPIFFFLGVLTLGLVYEMKKKGLEWER
ncbi:NADH-quinone oxidoreductase subunit A [Cerasicoccus arenae]|uniref:NADH-quinone oxidoreductase subunit n=1 Tax=Cerasicoccus arenae TaxID=424488 RepID=A0A8J3GE50_9BACT|nr:NADH-quinone oxidoreductase subunit A [Cerasicoccus arenae]MBK1857284.1 NADH-quinone oxidoreductase subunit A [Cerasicoccus arenae]GHC00458.1 NADH-quinone oxidoreductase subunit A [Cerasicoccus arenae]